MAAIDLAKLEKWIRTGETIVKSPLFGLLKPLLPQLGLTPEQIVLLDKRHADYLTRLQRARNRAVDRPPST